MSLIEALQQRVLIADGAMGTQLQLRGLPLGGCGESWNVERPERVLAIHRAYVDAGAELLTTNTFGGSRVALARHGQDGLARELSVAGARLARQAFGHRVGFVLGDIGPFGGFLAPYGDDEPEAVRSAFREQAEALLEGGADAILLETMSALEELAMAIEGARQAGAACVIASLAYAATPAAEGESCFRTLAGVTPAEAARFVEQQGVDIIGVNCGIDIDATRAAAIVSEYRRASTLPVIAQPNAGSPVREGELILYRQDPDQARALLDAGARILGGCCGTTPVHIRRISQLLRI
jgi:5-methyltetrahydrofolate--homocysteine methyltransferase